MVRQDRACDLACEHMGLFFEIKMNTVFSFADLCAPLIFYMPVSELY
jgi:hypothetical protein